MAQQNDPNADPATRGMSGQQGIVAGSQDTYRAKGFASPNVTPPSNTLSGVTAAPGAPAAPTTGTFGKWTGTYTPGILAASQAGGSGVPGGDNGINWLNTALFGGLIGSNKNNSQLQDIAGALYQGLPVTDQNWANAGYGPGGATLATPSGSTPQTGLRAITAAPAAVGAMMGPAAGAAFGSQQQQQPVGTIPANATLRTY